MRMSRWCLLAGIGMGLIALGPPLASAAVVVPDGGFVVSGSTPEVKEQIDAAHAAGARWVSIGTSWEQLEPTPDGHLQPGSPGAAEMAELGEQLAHAEALQVSVEIRLVNAPGWASGRAGVSDDPPTPGNLPAYGAFLGDLAERFGPLIDAYSPWNEPNRVAFWNPVSPEAYTALQKVAYTAIKAKDPTATVLSAPVVGRYAGVDSGYAFLRRAYEAGLKGHADIVGWTGYPGGEPESPSPVTGVIPAGNTLPAQLYLRDLINQYDPGRKVWIMEIGWSTCVSCNVSAANAVTEAQQADYLTRAFTYRRRYLTGITERIFWYKLRDDRPDRNDWFANQGVLRADMSPKPALAAFRALGVDVSDGTPLDPTVPGPGAAPVLPAAAARLALPSSATSAKGGRLAVGRARLTSRRGFFTMKFRVSVAGGRSALRIEGFRAKRWRLIATTSTRRSGTISIRFRDKAYAGFRIRGTVPGRSGFRVGRIVKIPAALVGGRRG